MTRPDDSEFAPYYTTYVSLVPDGEIGATLAAQIEGTAAQMTRASDEQENFRYEVGKWSAREALGHVVETERMFTGRALWIARQPGLSLPGMDQDAWITTAGHDARSFASHLEEWRAVRASTIALLRGLPADALDRTGIASDVSFTVRSFFWIIAGHELHHRALFRERYGIG